MQDLEQVGEIIDVIRRINFSKFANEQSSSGKSKLQPGSSLETSGQVVAADSKNQKSLR